MNITKDSTQFLLAEYTELKGEISKRTEIQHQLVSIALVALGALITVGVKDSPAALLAYPMLALFLSAAWSYNDIQIAQIGKYIQYRIEENLIGEDLGWEHAIKADLSSKFIGKRIILATRGILLGSEALALGLYLLTRRTIHLPKGEVVLLIFSIAATAATVLMTRNQDLLVDQIDKNMRTLPVAARTAKVD